ncbi:MAG: hypothetical protein R3F13_00495 [Prosthecobacter sp.]
MKSLVLWSLALLVVIAWLSQSTLTYHATCANCLAQAHGREISVLGVRVNRSLDIRTNPDYPELPPDGSATYQRIMGQACTHQFKRGGMGRSSLGMISCGHFPEEHAFSPRIQAIREMFLAFQRIGKLELARDSFRWIDTELKGDDSLRDALNYSRRDLGPTYLNEFARVMKSVKTEAEWRRILDRAERRQFDPPVVPD